jgi:hypothetical protein
MHALKHAQASVACIPKQLLPLLAVRPSFNPTDGEHSYQFDAIEVAPRRTAHAGTLATHQSFELKA